MLFVSLLLLAGTKPHGRAYEAYLAALRREVHLSPEGGNHSATPGVLRAMTTITPRSLVLAVPPQHVYTVSEALGAVSYINKCSKTLPRTLPRHFVLAAFVLHQRYVAPRGGLVRLWLESLPPLDATCLWSDEELALLDDDRVVRRSKSRREQLRTEYRQMMHVLLDEGGMEDDVSAGPTAASIDWEREYAWAVCVVTRYAWHFAADFPVIVPLSLRFHPSGSADIAEWGDENDPGAAVYAAEHGSLQAKQEVTVFSEATGTVDLLVHGGYVWDDARNAHIDLVLNAGADGERRLSEVLEEKRDALLSGANWTRQMSFELSASTLNRDMMTWLRLVFASADELQLARTHDDFGHDGSSPLEELPQSVRRETESAAVNALLATVQSEVGRFDHSIDEDEVLLMAHARAERGEVGGGTSATALLPRRSEIAIRYRRLYKQLLISTLGIATAHLHHWNRAGAKAAAKVRTLPVDSHGLVGEDGEMRSHAPSDHADGEIDGATSKKRKKKRRKRKLEEAE